MAQTWEEALDFGHQVEEYVLSRIHQNYPKAFIRDGRHKEWDIYVPETKLRIEVKSDVYSNKTGNLVVETSYNNRLSGITTSTADFWVFFTGFRLIWITKKQLLVAIKESDVKEKKFKGGSDRHEKTAFFVPVYFIEVNASQIDEPLTDLPSNFNFRKQ